MASSELLWHLEGREQQKSALETLSVAAISKRPESVATALQQNHKANEIAGRIVWSERANQIQQDNPHDVNPDTLSRDLEIAKIQRAVYESLGIDKNTNANNPIKKFTKWMIDGLFVGNAEIVTMIKNEGIEKFLVAIKLQFSSLEWIGQILKAVWMSIWDLATGDAYKRWKSLAELWLITTGAGAAGSLSKFAGKAVIQASVRVGEKTVLRTAASQTLHAVGRTAELAWTWLQLPAKWVKKVADGTVKVVGAISEKTGVSATLRTGARVWSEIYERSGAKTVVEWTKQTVKSTLDKGLKTLWVTETIQTVKWKVAEVIETIAPSSTEAVKASDKYTPEILSKLADGERVAVASEILWRTLTQEEKIAILKAHNLWEWWIENYSLSDIRSKSDILKQAGFSPEERRILMEKWVCGTETKLDILSHTISEVDVKRQLDWIQRLEKLWFPESLARDILESWLLNREFFWGDLLKRLQALEKKWPQFHEDFSKMIESAINARKEFWLTREEALTIFAYTDKTIFQKLNTFMRWSGKWKTLRDSMTPEQIEVTNRLIWKLEVALSKMPDMEWKLAYRWDSWKGWNKDIGTPIDLEAFTSIAHNSKDTFLAKDKNILVVIEWKTWKIKDITSLALVPQLWKHFPALLDKLTETEGILLPDSKVIVIWNEIKMLEWFDIRELRVKQTE
jgi:hypothetical protein